MRSNIVKSELTKETNKLSKHPDDSTGFNKKKKSPNESENISQTMTLK